MGTSGLYNQKKLKRCFSLPSCCFRTASSPAVPSEDVEYFDGMSEKNEDEWMPARRTNLYVGKSLGI